MSQKHAEELDQLAALLRKLPPERIEDALGKTARVSLYLSPLEKDAVSATAEAFGLTLNSYIVRVLMLVESVLREESRRK